MMQEVVVELSRWQFAITAMLHFLFIPLTLGLGLLLALAESAYVFTGQRNYQAMARFWSHIFAVNFVLALATRLAVLFQFGMNGSYFSLYVGDVFALPLAIETLTSFFLASALFGPYWFGWNKLGKYQHLCVTWLIAIAVHVSAYWIMLANAWMQYPVSAAFNYQAYRVELQDFAALLNNPVVCSKFVHTVAASYVAAMAAVLAVSAYRLRSNNSEALFRSSYKLAAGFGLVGIAVTLWLGDKTPYLDHPVQQAKLAAISGTPGKELLPAIELRIRSGIQAYSSLEMLRDENRDPETIADFERHRADLGYAALLKPWNKNIVDAKDKQIAAAAQSALPGFPKVIYWAYRLMIVCGIGSLLLFLFACWNGFRQNALSPWLLNFSVYLAVLPWLACITGWFVAEAGKQPWAIAGILPTFLGVSSLSVKELIISLIGHVLIYGGLLIAGLCLFRQAIQQRQTTE